MTLNTLIKWIYCMDYPQVLLLLAGAAGLARFLRKKYGSSRFWTPAAAGLLLLWGTVVTLQTLGIRTPGSGLAPILRPFQSYADALKEGGQIELLRSNFMNAVLFFPAGVLAASLRPDRRYLLRNAAAVLAASAVFSAAIEFAQYRFHLGLAQTDDVIHNVLGTAAGLAAMLLPRKNNQ